jgi:hypothetical protein
VKQIWEFEMEASLAIIKKLKEIDEILKGDSLGDLGLYIDRVDLHTIYDQDIGSVRWVDDNWVYVPNWAEGLDS